MKIILNQQALDYLQQIEKGIREPENIGGVFFDGEAYCWVGFKIKDGNFETDTFDTHEEALRFVIR